MAQRKEVERENKADDEDYLTIDKKFNEQIDQLNIDLTRWSELQKSEIDGYFKEVFERYQALREYVNMYTFAIPATFFSLYQQKLDTFNEVYNK